MFKIEKGIAMPDPRCKGTTRSIFPIDQMEIGDSFEVVHADVEMKHTSIPIMCSTLAKKLGVKVAARCNQERTKVRIWRIA